MRHWTLPFLTALALATAACGGSTNETPAPDTSDVGSSKGQPTASAKVAIPEARRKAIAAVQVEGFDRQSGRDTRVGASLYFLAASPNKIGRRAEVRVQVTGCGGILCGPVTGDEAPDAKDSRWQRHLPRVHQNNPSLRFDLERREFGTWPAIVSYAQSMLVTEQDGGVRRQRAHVLKAELSDGHYYVTIEVVPGSGGPRPKTLADLQQEMSKAEMLQHAKRVFEGLQAHLVK